MYASLLRFQRDKVFDTFSFLLASSDFCHRHQFGPRSGLTDCLSSSGSKLFNTLIVFLKIVSRLQQKHEKIPNLQRDIRVNMTEYNPSKKC